MINSALRSATLMAILFSFRDVSTIFDFKPTYPCIGVIFNTTRACASTAVMVAFIVVAVVTLVIGTLATAFRMLWARARDKDVPGWQVVSR